MKENKEELLEGSTVSESTEVSSKSFSRREILKVGAFTVVAVAGSSLLVACSNGNNDETPKPDKRTITNVNGTEITIPYEVTKVAALFGPSYERVVVVGAEDRIMCDGDFHIDGWPWSNLIFKYVNTLPGIENAHADFHVEDLIAMGVQLVFCWANQSQVDMITNAGMVAVPSAGTGKARDIVETIRVFADIFNDELAHEQATAYAQYFDDTFAMVKARTANVAIRPKVYLGNTTLLATVSASSDMAEVIDAAGGVLASIDLPAGSSTNVNVEQVLQWNPDYIFLDHAGSSGNASSELVISEAKASGSFNSVTAFQNDHVFATPTGAFFWDSGIQKILYLVYIAKTIHPTLFADVDLKAMLIDFYKQFYFYTLTDNQATRILNHQDPL